MIGRGCGRQGPCPWARRFGRWDGCRRCGLGPLKKGGNGFAVHFERGCARFDFLCVNWRQLTNPAIQTLGEGALNRRKTGDF